MFGCYTKCFDFLSPNALTWSFSLVILFFNALPLDLQETVGIGDYVLPDLSRLSSSS